jgi:hypothetical protein
MLNPDLPPAASRVQRAFGGIAASILLAFLLTLPACGFSRSGGDARLQSLQNSNQLRASLPTRVYTAPDADTADIYMTDLPDSVWTAGADVSDMTGTLIHVHMFIRPRAGRTPIADTASTATIRCMVLAKGEIGVYAGGGFFVNADETGEKTFRAGVRDATLRLMSATGGFNDRLGVCSFSGEVSGKHDQPTAAAIAWAMGALLAETTPVE